MDGFIDWVPGDPPLSDTQHAGNLRVLRDGVTALRDTDGNEAIIAAPQSADLRTVTLQTAMGRSFPFVLPPGPVFPRGERVVAAHYDVDDLITWQGSSYIVLLPHNASMLLADDLAAGRLQLVAAKGRDAEVQRGAYQAGLAYAASDTVYVGTPGETEVVWYRAMADVPEDGPAPGSYPWAQIGLTPYVELTVDVLAKPGNGAILKRYVVPRTTFLLAGLARSAASLETAPTSACTYSVKVDGTEVATFSFAAGSKVATFALAEIAYLFKGQRVTIVAPSPQDATAAGLAVTLTLNR